MKQQIKQVLYPWNCFLFLHWLPEMVSPFFKFFLVSGRKTSRSPSGSGRTSGWTLSSRASSILRIHPPLISTLSNSASRWGSHRRHQIIYKYITRIARDQFVSQAENKNVNKNIMFLAIHVRITSFSSQAFLEDPNKPGKFTEALDPVCSTNIFDAKVSTQLLQSFL